MADKASHNQGADQATPASFEQNLQALEDAVRRLEEGNLPLEESLHLYEDGVRAFRACQKMLQEADLKVRKLVETLEGELKEEAFEPPEQ
ncbi:MAG: hypothetical protein AMK73_05275 [Planctomycetes bacterium SM23_32]|nr:MAG: hypothetical protein AMK73_05275 [Planctomycetes bacterium SM23_32]